MPIGGGSSTITIGTTAFSGGTTGSILFVGASSVIQQDNANIFWDNTNDRLSLRNTSAVATGQPALVASDIINIGITGASATGNRTTFVFNNQGWNNTPSIASSTSNGDKFVFFNDGTGKVSQGSGDSFNMWWQASGGTGINAGFQWWGGTGASPALVMRMTAAGRLYLFDTTLLSTGVSLTNGAGASTGTLTNAPAVGNPTKWIPIDDNGTTRYIPAW